MKKKKTVNINLMKPGCKWVNWLKQVVVKTRIKGTVAISGKYGTGNPGGSIGFDHTLILYCDKNTFKIHLSDWQWERILLNFEKNREHYNVLLDEK